MGNYALLIGVSTYHHLPDLELSCNAQSDVAALQEILACSDAQPFTVTTLSDPSKAEMENAIQTFLQNRVSEDVLVLTYAGHGMGDRHGRISFLTADSCLLRGGELSPTSAVAASTIQTLMDSCPARQVVILSAAIEALKPGMLEADLGGEGRVVLWSGNTIPGLSEEPLSAYVEALRQGVLSGQADGDGDRQLSAMDLHDYARAQLANHLTAGSPELIALRPQDATRSWLQLPQRDPHQIYRNQVVARLEQGKLSAVGRVILDTYRKQLGLSAAAALAIETDVLRPYQEHADNLRTYRQAVQKALQESYPLPQRVVKELEDLQGLLHLTAGDVEPIHAAELGPYAEAEEQRQQHRKALQREIQQEIERAYPVAEATLQRLQHLYQGLGLGVDEVRAIAQKLLAAEEQRQQAYQHQLKKFAQAWGVALEQQFPPDAVTLRHLQRQQVTLGVREADARAIAHRAIQQAEATQAAYQAKLERYRDGFLAIARAHPVMGKEQRDRLQRLQDELGLGDRAIEQAEALAFAILTPTPSTEQAPRRAINAPLDRPATNGTHAHNGHTPENGHDNGHKETATAIIQTLDTQTDSRQHPHTDASENGDNSPQPVSCQPDTQDPNPQDPDSIKPQTLDIEPEPGIEPEVTSSSTAVVEPTEETSGSTSGSQLFSTDSDASSTTEEPQPAPIPQEADAAEGTEDTVLSNGSSPEPYSTTADGHGSGHSNGTSNGTSNGDSNGPTLNAIPNAAPQPPSILGGATVLQSPHQNGNTPPPPDPSHRNGNRLAQFVQGIFPAAPVATLDPPAPSAEAGEGIDYEPLRRFLEQKDWQSADRETLHVMLQATGHATDSSLTLDAVVNFPCKDLEILCDLWNSYSEGQFGFLAQDQVYQAVYGEPTRQRHADGDRLWEVASRLKWTNKMGNILPHFRGYHELDFSGQGVSGHLPALWFFHVTMPSVQKVSPAPLHRIPPAPDLRMLSALIKHLKACNIT